MSLAGVAALNSAEKKATRDAQAVADETSARVKKACGNESLRFTVDWTGYKDLDYTTGGFSREKAMRNAGDRADRVGNAMIAVCANLGNSGDAKVAKIKDAISHLKEVRFSPQNDEKNFRIELSRQGDTLQARFGAFGVAADEDLTAEVRKQF